MDYPKLYEAVGLKISRLEIQIQNIREKIGVALAIAGRHETKGREKLYDKKHKAIEALRAKETELFHQIAVLRGHSDEIAVYQPVSDQKESLDIQNSPFYWAGQYKVPVNTRWGAFNLIFVRPYDRMRLKRTGPLATADSYDDCPLESCAVDPDRISDVFLKGVGMPLPKKGMDPFQKLQFKETLIPEVKHFFENHVEPLEKGRKKNWRLMIVNKYGYEHDGKIINPRGSGNGNGETADRKFIQVFESAYATRRKTDHVDTRYKAETRLIIDTEEDLHALHQRILALMGQPKEPEELEAIKEEMKQKITLFQKSINLHKKTAYLDLQKVSELKDSLQRQNLGASCARLLSILRHLKTRRTDVFSTSLASPEDAKTLEQVIEFSERMIAQYEKAFWAVVQNGELRPLLTLRDRISQLKVRPFNLYASAIQRMTDSILTASQSAQRTPKTSALKGVAASRLLQIEKERESIVAELSSLPLTPDPEVFLEYGRRLYRSVNTHEVRAEHALFDAIRNHLKCLAWELKRAHKSKKSSESLYKLFKEGLQAIDFSSFLSQL